MAKSQVYSDAVIEVPLSLIVSVCALGGGGKTDFACSAPGDIAYVSVDPNNRPVVRRWQMGQDTRPKKRIHVTQIERPSSIAFTNRNDKSVQQEAESQWDRFMEANELVITGRVKVRTMVWDTATELYDIQFLKEFGRTEKIQWFQRAAPNKEFGDLITAYRGTDINLILLHRLKKKYESVEKKVRGPRGVEIREERDWTGTYEREGFSKTEFLVAAEVHLMKDLERGAGEDEGGIGNRFGVKVVKATDRPVLEGEEYWGIRVKKDGTRVPRNDFAALATQIFPDTTRGDWA